MTHISAPVGRGSQNKQHDVAVIQAALAQISRTPQGGGGKLWSKPVDGRASPDLERAIGAFQSRERLSPTGRIEPTGPGMMALDRILPQDWRGLAGIEGTSAIACSACPSHASDAAIRTLKERTLLPRAAAEGLASLAREIFRAHGLVPRADGHGIDGQGRLVQRLAFADTKWLAFGNRLDPNPPPNHAQQVLGALRRRPLAGWNG
jgi:peptidoglycan hydrolase-like protein with peptidoglycan-binding domain